MGTYTDMLPGAVEVWVPVEGADAPLRVLCADLASIYHSKASLDRPKDARALDFLEEVLGLPPRVAPVAAGTPGTNVDEPDEEILRLRRKIAEIQRRSQRPAGPGSSGLGL